jgi:hypothetical protein
MSTLTFDQAMNELDSVHTKEQLTDLIRRLDTNTHGSVTVLYSGMLDSDMHSMDVISGLKNNPDYRILDNTDAFKFLAVTRDVVTGKIENLKLHDKMVQIFGDMPNDRGSDANNFLFGSKGSDGVRIPTSAFDIVSANFAQGASGKVIALVNFANIGQVFGASELPNILENVNVTHLNGISIEDLKKIKESDRTTGMEKLFNEVKNGSIIHTAQYSYSFKEVVNHEGKLVGSV